MPDLPDNSRHTLEMAVLKEVSRALIHHQEVDAIVQEVLDILHREMGLQRGTITLRQGDELRIAASHGLSEEERARGRYFLGEGVTGKVAQTARSALIPDISADPNFLNRTQTRCGEANIAFLCAPVIHDDEVIGTMSIDRQVTPGADLARDLNLLEIVTNILADAIAGCRAKLAEREKLISENRRLQEELEKIQKPGNIVGNCQAMKSVYAMISQVAASNATVLIRGSSGTGKELVARAIQYYSSRRSKPFVVVNCAALPENLVESELFGHEKGAFTGAMNRRVGRVEAADTGTIFLDEIGDLSTPMQVKLLRFLQERTFQRIGSNEEHKVDVRVLAATSRNLEKLMEEGLFREDLYYRLNVFPIQLPDLADRKSDLAALTEFFLEKFNRQHHKNVRRISVSAMNMLLAYHWPGNVRELENTLERAVLTARDGVVHSYDLPPVFAALGSGAAPAAGGHAEGLEVLVRSYERGILTDALKLHRGNVSAAARQLKTTPRILRYKLVQLGISPADFKR